MNHLQSPMHSARDQDALGVHAGEDVAEALAFLADQVFRRHAQIVEEHFRRRVVHHGADRVDLHAGALRRRMSTRNTERPSVRFFICSRGVVRASSSIRSECSAREVQIFCPLMT